MTDPQLMDADCIHGVAWYECRRCESERWTVVEGGTAIKWPVDDDGHIGLILPGDIADDTAWAALVAAVRDSERLPAVTAERDALRAENEDLRWLVGWLSRDGREDMLPPRLVPLVQACHDEMSWSKYTVAGPYPLAASSPDTERVTPEQATELAAAREATGVEE